MLRASAAPGPALPEDRFTKPRPDCRHPERWHSTDPDSTEVEVSHLVGAFVRALQPDLVVETGTAFGQTAYEIGCALADNGQGELITYEPDINRTVFSSDRCKGLPVTVVCGTSLAGIEQLVNDGRRVGFAWLDSMQDIRVDELLALRPILTPQAVVGLHDTGPHHAVRRYLAPVLSDRTFHAIQLPTPRGVTFLQAR